MKRTIWLPILAIAFFASQAWAQFCNYGACSGSTSEGYGCVTGGCYILDGACAGGTEVAVCPAGTLPPKIAENGGYPTTFEYCQWTTGCQLLNTAAEKAECERYGSIYKDVPSTSVGDDKSCSAGGTWIGGKDPNYNGGVPLFCKWGTGCERVMDDEGKENCIESGSLFENVPAAGQGAGKDCSGGEWTGEGRDPSVASIGCCNWRGLGVCNKIYTEKEKTDCGTANFLTTCAGDEAGTCPAGAAASSSSAAVAQSSSSSAAANSSSSSAAANNPSSSSANVTYCVVAALGTCVTGLSAADCNSLGGTISTSCAIPSSSSNASNESSSSAGSSSSANSSSSGDSSSSSSADGDNGSSSSASAGDSSSSSGAGDGDGAPSIFQYCVLAEGTPQCISGTFTLAECVSFGRLPSSSCPYESNTPIVSVPKLAHGNSLSAMQNAVNLQTKSGAAVRVYDLKGNAVRAFKFEQGNYVVPLSGLPRGLYIVKASGASWKQTVAVPVK